MTKAPSNNADENVKLFLRDMAKLSKKYGLAVGGSGDLGSTWVYAVKDEKILLCYLGSTWVYAVKDEKILLCYLEYCQPCGCYTYEGHEGRHGDE